MGFAGRERGRVRVATGAHVGEDEAEEEAKDDGGGEGADEAFPRLVGRQLEKGRPDVLAAEGEAGEVGEAVVVDDEGGREHEPEEALVDVEYDGASLEDHDGED